MFPRVIPNIDEKLLVKILMNKNNKKNICSTDNFKEELYFFNSGRAALKFLLSLKFKNKKIGIQNFTCSIMKDVIIETKNIPVILDINRELFSTSLDEIKKYEIDVLILTHLFGIPNAEYFKIKEYCIEKNIFLIDDLSQTIFSEVDNKVIEKYSDYYIYSFAFDKPISSLEGGALHIPAEENFMDRYNAIPKTSEFKGYLNLKIFYLYYSILKSKLLVLERTNTYFERCLYYIFTINFAKKNKIIKFFYRYKVNLFIFKIENKIKKIFYKNKNIKIQRLSEIEKVYIIEQIKNYKKIDKELLYLKAKKNILALGGEIKEIKFRENIKISYRLRFPILQFNQEEIIQKLLKKKIESGNHNWGEVIDRTADTPISKEMTNQIVNIPIWSDEIWN